MPAVYTESRKIGASLMRSRTPGRTLQPAVLIQEAYIKVDHARQRCAQKRGLTLPTVYRDLCWVGSPLAS